MSRRKGRHNDRIADQVADEFLKADLDRAIEDVPEYWRIVAEAGRYSETELAPFRAPERIGIALAGIRADRRHRRRLLAYLGDRLPVPNICQGCGNTVERQKPTGRRPEHCNNVCRQRAYRNRQRLLRREEGRNSTR